YQAWAAQELQDDAGAAEAFQRYLAEAPRDATWGEAALALIRIQVRQGDLPGASRGLAHLRDHLQWVDNLAGLEVLSLELGDAWLRSGDPEAALAAYDLVSPREELVRRQGLR